jgi:hypothetical protein
MSGEEKEYEEYQGTANLPGITGAAELIGGKRGEMISPCLPPSRSALAVEAPHEVVSSDSCASFSSPDIAVRRQPYAQL